MDLKGREAQAFFALKNQLVPEEHEEECFNLLPETLFALDIFCSTEPTRYFDLASTELRKKRLQIFADYVHPTLMNTVQLLKRQGA